MKRWLGLLGLIACGVALPADDAALRTVESCRARLDARVDIGIERIQKRCPELLPALASAPWRDLLPLSMRERREEITAESLRALAELVRQSRDGAARRDAPTRDRLEPVLANLDDKGEQGVTRWERFKRWLKDKLENRKDDDDAGWLEKFARQFKTSEGVAQFITYTGYALVGVLVALVIWSELRAAGFFGGVRRASSRAEPGGRMAPATAARGCGEGAARRTSGNAAAVARRSADARAAAAGRGGPHGLRDCQARTTRFGRRTRCSARRRRHRRGGALRCRFASRCGYRRNRRHGESAARKFRPAGRSLMRERGVAFLLALAALAAFYGLWLRPSPSFDPDADIARPTTAERRGNGYAGLYEWLQRSGVEVRSLRERYGSLSDLDLSSRGNLLILSLPAVEVFHSDELSALDRWVRRGNTLLINAALLDQPDWAARRSAGAVVEIESLTAIEFETPKATRVPARRHSAGATRARSGCARCQEQGR